MKIFTSLLALLGIAASAAFTNLSPDEFQKLIAQPGVGILDVRTPAEFAEGHIAGAINIDVTASDFKARVADLKLKKSTCLAVYCRSGRRSANACNILSSEGYGKLNNLSTGIIGWTEAGKPIVKK